MGATHRTNYREMWRYFAFQPVSFWDFITFRWFAVMLRRGSWPTLQSKHQEPE